MDTILIAMILLVPFAFLLYQALHRVKCPDCGETLPLFYSPFKKTRRMWRAGGYLCARCGCETNMAGQKVTADTPPPPVPARLWALLSVLLLVGIGLGVAGWLVTARTAAPPAVPAPPVVVLPQQVPPAGPAN
jgi:DNA-directed RNA polymerase subunit RPC12/RpoP